MGALLKQLCDLLTLKSVEGSRSQLTLVAMGILNLVVQLGFIQLTPENLKTINDFLILVTGYFFAEKVSKLSK